MMTWDEVRGYDSSDLESVEKRAWLMVGKSLGELDVEINSRSTFNEKDLGWSGKVIHRWFIDDDNFSEPDLPNVPHPELRHVGLEIKAVPLGMGKRGDWLVKFPMSLAMIDYEEIYGSEEIETIEDSVIFRKDRWTLAVYYSHGGYKPDGTILGLGIWDVERLSFRTIARDYYKINRIIKGGGAHELSETLSDVLSARRKGGAGQKRSGGEGVEDAKTRAWALKAQYVRKRLELDRINSPKPPRILEHDGMDEDSSRKVLSGLNEQITRHGRPIGPSFDDNVISWFIRGRLSGKTVSEVADELGYDSLGGKDVHSRVARLMLHRRKGGLGELGGSRAAYIDGKLVKVFTVDENHLPTEYGLKMPHVPLTELAQENWEDCSLIQNLHSVLLIPVRKAESLIGGEYLHPMIWKPNRMELERISREWRLFRDSIRSGKAKRYAIGSRNTNDLPTKEQTDFLHMRPSARDGSITELDPLGNVCTRLTLWLNDTAVQGLFLRRKERWESVQRRRDSI
jgi:DNA mismatch repair protein MutH